MEHVTQKIMQIFLSEDDCRCIWNDSRAETAQNVVHEAIFELRFFYYEIQSLNTIKQILQI